MSRLVAGPLTIEQARKAYGTILTTLRTERERRVQFLKGDLRDLRVAEIDKAMDALILFATLTSQAIEAGLLAGDAAAVPAEQAVLLEVPEEGGRYA